MHESMKFLIWTKPYDERWGGIITLHSLANDLCILGEEAYVTQKKNPLWLGEVASPEALDLEDTWVIYPEIISGNPFDAPHVVRWLLNNPGTAGGDGVFQDSDLIFKGSGSYQASRIDGELWSFGFRLDAMQDDHQPREGDCYLLRKGKYKINAGMAVHDPSAVCIDDYSGDEDLRRYFNKHRRLISYDEDTFIIHQAALCGCIPLVVPDASRRNSAHRQDFYHRIPYGAGYGVDPEAERHARDTLHLVRPRLLELEASGRQTVRDFVAVCRNALETRSTRRPGTTFFVPKGGKQDDALAAFFDAFSGEDDVEIELRKAPEDLGVEAERLTKRLLQRDPAFGGRVRVVHQDAPMPLGRYRVHLDQQARQPNHLPRIDPELMRQAAGLHGPSRSCCSTSLVVLTGTLSVPPVAFLEEIYRSTPEPFELVVVDDGKDPYARKPLQNFAQEHADVTLIFPPAQVGYATGSNQALAVARGDYLVLFEGDVALAEGWLPRMLRVLEGDPDLGIVIPKRNERRISYKTPPQMRDFARQQGRMLAGHGAYVEAVFDPAVLVVRKDLLTEIGGLDPCFESPNFATCDFGLRARLSSWKIWAASDAYVHQGTFVNARGGYDPDERDPDVAVREDRDRPRFASKWWSGPLSEATDVKKLVSEHIRDTSSVNLLIPLPGPAGVPVFLEPIEIAGLKCANLLLDADWKGPVERWLPAVAAFAEAFAARDPVTMLVAGAGQHELERIAATMEARGEDGPDILSLPAEYEGKASLLGACQGVIAAHPERSAEVRRLAEILGKPVIDDIRPAALAEWGQSGGRPSSPYPPRSASASARIASMDV